MRLLSLGFLFVFLLAVTDAFAIKKANEYLAHNQLRHSHVPKINNEESNFLHRIKSFMKKLNNGKIEIFQGKTQTSKCCFLIFYFQYRNAS